MRGSNQRGFAGQRSAFGIRRKGGHLQPPIWTCWVRRKTHDLDRLQCRAQRRLQRLGLLDGNDALAREGVRLGIGFHPRISETGIGNQLGNVTATVKREHLSRGSTLR